MMWMMMRSNKNEPSNDAAAAAQLAEFTRMRVEIDKLLTAARDDECVIGMGPSSR